MRTNRSTGAYIMGFPPHLSESDLRRSERTTLASGITAQGNEARLIHATPGYEPAGSACRWREREGWCVSFSRSGQSVGGQWYKSEPEARERFALAMAKES